MPHLSGNHIIARSGPRISIDDGPLKNAPPRRQQFTAGNRGVESTTARPSIRWAADAGFFDFLVDRRFPELPSEQPHSSGEAAIIRGARKSQRVITATGHQARADRQPGRHLVGF